jgi:hypothetical protein
VRVAIQGNCLGTNWANVFHAQLTTSSAIISADLLTWLTSFSAQFKTSFAPRQGGNINYVNASATLYSPGGGVLQSVYGMTGSGTGGGILADNAAAKVISWSSTVYWRGGKPRTYLAGVQTADIRSGTANELATAEMTSMGTAGSGFRTAINALTTGTITGTTIGFVSFSSGNVPRTTPIFYPFTGCVIHPRLATQRRRLGKWQV